MIFFFLLINKQYCYKINVNTNIYLLIDKIFINFANIYIGYIEHNNCHYLKYVIFKQQVVYYEKESLSIYTYKYYIFTLTHYPNFIFYKKNYQLSTVDHHLQLKY